MKVIKVYDDPDTDANGDKQRTNLDQKSSFEPLSKNEKKIIHTCNRDENCNKKVPHNLLMTENMIFNKKEITMVNILQIKYSAFKLFLFLMYEYVDIFTTFDRFTKTQRENHDKTK